MSTPTAQVIDEIIVRDCTVTVTRRGGWSWGPDPHGLIQLVVNELPDLLGAEFAGYLTEDGPDVEITEPVTVTVRLGSGQWFGSSGPPAEVVMSPVSAASVEVVAAGDEQPSGSAESFMESFAAVSPADVRSVGALFAELAQRDDLEPLLALLPEESLRVFLRSLARESSAVVSQVAEELARRHGAELADHGGTELASGADVERFLESLPTPVPADHPVAAQPVSVRAARGETEVGSVLPFLLAGPLARIGYLDAIGPALDGLDMAEEAPLFAAALAYKVLGAVARGWRRTPEDNASAAAFAGLDSVPDLTDFARQVRPALPVLDAVLALSLCRGHDPGEPLVIMGVGGRLLLVDALGTFPVAWSSDVAGLLAHWEGCGRPSVLVRGSLPAGCMRDLAAAGVSFVTDVRPLRGDPVSRLPWRSPLWTCGSPDSRLVAAASGHAARVDSVVQALVVERRAVPLAQDASLERSVTLAASVGLGMIAWTLWHARETPDPVLALSRFADLSAVVRYGADAVQVRIPLGRRHSDLLRGGLLADVPDVVWLGGRTLTFSGG
nr:hypothetical protein [Kibdelosporangium sp. MJ126-NF4]CEL16455.1 hypothetical protein [Kibdelosporangium sp. MJ126-NF4]CTQ90407.1 hypothetical protein [Kibdelosporangium sp. MJ126-NF4]